MNTQTRETTSMSDAQAKAGTLIEALPWIQRFAGTTMVIKYGGNAMVNDELRRAFAEDVVFLHHVGIHPVVVHGGGPQIDELLMKMGIKSQFVRGMRVTDQQTLDIVDRAYIMFDGQVKVSGTVRNLVFDDTVADIYLGPTLTARLRERFAHDKDEVTAS